MFELKFVLLLCYLITNVLTIEYDYVCKVNVIDIETHKPINNVEDYCKGYQKPCASKCCGRGEVLYRRKKTNITWYMPECVSTSSLDMPPHDYKEVGIYSSFIQQHVKKTKQTFLDDFHLIQNGLFANKSCSDRTRQPPYFLENGLVAWKSNISNNVRWVLKDPAYYCIDIGHAEGAKGLKVFLYVAKESTRKEEKQKSFIGIASLISSIFLFLVLLVYSVLPERRNLSGMLLMAYTGTLLCTFIIKAVIIFAYKLNLRVTMIAFCFVCLSVFFWLNIMSFDIWWTFRGQRLKRAINRRGELVKFGWYSLYGWGAPLLITIVAAILDSQRDKLPSIVTPDFENGFNNPVAIAYYLQIPIGILTVTNVVLFLMTIYNMWLINSKLSKFKNSSNSNKKNQNRFSLYAKMSLLMGSSWLIDIIQILLNDIKIWAYIALNMYNSLIGAIIFILFILNRKTLKLLCKRFNIKCRFTEDKCRPSTSRSTTKSSTNNGSFTRSEATDMSDTEMDEVCTHPNP